MIVITSANLLRAIWMPNEICNARAATPAPKRDEKTLRPEPRMVRLVSRFLAAVLIGVGLTLAGQSYGEQLNDMIMGWAPSLAWLLPAQSPKKTAEGAVSSDVAQQIKLIAVDLASVRRNMGQLAANQDQFAAKQEQMNQSIATGSRSSKIQTASSCTACTQAGASSGAQSTATIPALSGCAYARSADTTGLILPTCANLCGAAAQRLPCRPLRSVPEAAKPTVSRRR
jgi:cobalamin biosynthesis Mg chelatase CobN